MSTLFAEARPAVHLMSSLKYTRQLNQNPDFYSVTASGNAKGAANALIDADDVPAVADIETWLEGTKNAVFARYAFGVRR